MLVALTILFLIFVQRPIFAGFIECSDDYFADYQVYGPCIAQKCGRFVAQLPEGIIVYKCFEFKKNVFCLLDPLVTKNQMLNTNCLQKFFVANSNLKRDEVKLFSFLFKFKRQQKTFG
jgi:hypothetical protein